jgi:2-dehydro-3-deoxy-D-arabinonate dehydratase
MKLTKIKWEGKVTAAVCNGEKGTVRPIPNYSLLSLIERAEVEKVSLSELAGNLASAHPIESSPVLPLEPKEVWACGCTYKASSSFRDAEHGTREGFYAHVYSGERPEIFFKGTARVCVGPGEPIGIRRDSRFTAPEPELAVVLGSKGSVVGYTLANDVSAWDIERENPLYLPQSKVYDGCCALGPVIVTTDELVDPYNLDMTCVITRGGETVYSGSTNTSNLNRKIEQLIEYLLRANAVPLGTVLLTGTGIIVPETAALQPGDICTIAVPEIGELSNPAQLVG